jgi:hypothetical protein
VKPLRSSVEDLRRIFERCITVRDIAEPFASFDSQRQCTDVLPFMEARGYDVIGIRIDGLVGGYALRGDLSGGQLGDHARAIDPELVLPDSSALLTAFERLRTRPWVLVSIVGRVWGFVSVADLQKAPVRMWLFGLISLAEMHTLRLVRELFPGEEWIVANLLAPARMTDARRVFEKRRRKGQETDLTDCLQLCDRATILKKQRGIFRELGFNSNAEAQRFFSHFEDLRNSLAHSQDILANRWPALADIAIGLEHFLHCCESRHAGSPNGDI